MTRLAAIFFSMNPLLRGETYECLILDFQILNSVLLQAWSGPEGSRKLGFADFMSTARGGGKIVSLTHRPHLPQEIRLVLISVRS